MAINNQPTIKPKTVTGIFTKYMAKTLPLAFDESMSYYECLCVLLAYINTKVVPALDNNAAGLLELQEFYLELQNYVNNYFKNLDVQEEINNKLDDMVESGVLEQIIEQFLQSSALWCFDTVADMKAATNLINGSYARTLGYYAINDDGGATYKITDTLSNTGHQETLNSGLYATLIINGDINVKQLGAYGDGIHDDNDAIEKAFVISYEYRMTDAKYSNYKTISFPNGIYLNNAQVYYEDNYLDRIIINGNNSIIHGYGFRFGAKPAHNIIINNLCFTDVNECLRFDAQNREYQSITLNNCVFINCENALYIDRQSTMVEFKNCQFRSCQKDTIYAINVDQIVFDNCWFEQKTESVDARSSVITQTGNSEGCIIAKNCFFIPQWTGTEISWFKISHMFQAENCRFSGESPNNTAIVYTDAQIENVSSSGHRTMIDIRNCPLISTPYSIIVEGLPDSIKYQNNSGEAIATPIIKWSSQVTEEQQSTKLINKLTKFKIFLSGNDMRMFDRIYGYINIPSAQRNTIPINMRPFIRRQFLNQDGNINYTIDSYSGAWPSFTSLSLHIRNINANYHSLLGFGFLVAYRINDSGVTNFATVINFVTLNHNSSTNLWELQIKNIVGGRTDGLVFKINGTEDSVNWSTVGDNFTIDITKQEYRAVEQVEIIPFSMPNILDCGE